MIVMKFGGTSVGSPERIRNVYEIVVSQRIRRPIVVVSAVGGVTDLLVKAGVQALNKIVDIQAIRDKHYAVLEGLDLEKEIADPLLKELEDLLMGIKMIREISPRISDLLLSFGERISCQIVSAYFRQQGTLSKHHFAFDIGMKTSSTFQGAEPLPEAFEEIGRNLKDLNYIPVITGFIGKTPDGEISTLGRGGSDYTAAIIGAGVRAEEIQIWTDVDGILTTDPRVVPHAFNVPEVSFKEAAELAYFGAKVLHPKTIRPAMEQNIPVVVKNTANQSHPGTRIIPEVKIQERVVKAISVKKNVTLVNIYSLRMLLAHGFLARIFRIFESYEVVVDVVSTSEVSVSVTVDKPLNLPEVIEELSEFAQVREENHKAILCVVGEGLHSDQSVSGRALSTLARHKIPVNMVSLGASDINLSMVIDQDQSSEAIVALHKEFFE